VVLGPVAQWAQARLSELCCSACTQASPQT